MRRAITALGVAALLALGACGNKKDSPAATGSGTPIAAGSGSAAPAGSGSSAGGSAAGSGSPAAAGTGSAAGSGAAAGSGSAVAVAVPTPEDFEKDATTKITDKNVEAQVQALEKDLDSK